MSQSQNRMVRWQEKRSSWKRRHSTTINLHIWRTNTAGAGLIVLDRPGIGSSKYLLNISSHNVFLREHFPMPLNGMQRSQAYRLLDPGRIHRTDIKTRQSVLGFRKYLRFPKDKSSSWQVKTKEITEDNYSLPALKNNGSLKNIVNKLSLFF